MMESIAPVSPRSSARGENGVTDCGFDVLVERRVVMFERFVV